MAFTEHTAARIEELESILGGRSKSTEALEYKVCPSENGDAQEIEFKGSAGVRLVRLINDVPYMPALGGKFDGSNFPSVQRNRFAKKVIPRSILMRARSSIRWIKRSQSK